MIDNMYWPVYVCTQSINFMSLDTFKTLNTVGI